MSRVHKVLSIITLLYLFTLSVNITAQDKEKDTVGGKDSKSYHDIVKESVVKKGLFNIYQNKEKIYFEVNDSLLGKDMLIVNKVSKVPYALNDHGLNKGMAFETKLIRFYKDKALNKLWVKTINPKVQVPVTNAIAKSVKDNFTESVIEVFDIEAVKPDSTAVLIQVNRIFDGRDKSFSDILGNTGLGGTIKTSLSKIETAKAFPQNVVVKSLLTTSVTEGGSAPLPLSIGTTTNIVLLPENVMKPRFSDHRIGYFTKPMEYYNDDQQEVQRRDLITRWRIEPRAEDIEKYKNGELVEPKKPIVYYIDPSTPKQWQPYIEKGIYNWNKAFESAGFKNVMRVKYVTDDMKDFDVDDVRYSVVIYAASSKKNAMGPSVVDPRSGEILESDVIWWHNLMQGLHYWLKVQTSSYNEEARVNVFSEELMGDAIRFASSHEIGHTLGLKHNMAGSYSYPVDSLRSETFTNRVKGTASSIMDYARYNYVAQPEDNISEFTPQIGVYDIYAINWGYRWLDVKTPEAETKTLNKWLRKHENDPLYFYGPQQSEVIDPRCQIDDLGNDVVKASQYGLMNLKRILPHIIDWTKEEGHSYYKAAKLYKAIINQWDLYNYHVMANIGGLYIDNTVYGDHKNTFTPVPANKQKEALDYLINNAITPQKWLFIPDFINKVYPVRDAPDGARYYSASSMMRMYQTMLIYKLLDTDRFMRIVENKILEKEGEEIFDEIYLLDKLYYTIFDKTIRGKSLDLFERMTQKNYIDVLTIERNKLLKKTTKDAFGSEENLKVHFSYIPRVSDEGSFKRGELMRILDLLKKKKNKGDRATKNHYADMIARIQFNLQK